MSRTPLTKAPRAVSRAAGTLARHLPASLPVRVAFTRRLPCWAYCERAKDHYLIVMSAELDRSLWGETLAHEWAHALAWGRSSSRVDHGRAWGICYGRAYRVLVEGWRPTRWMRRTPR